MSSRPTCAVERPKKEEEEDDQEEQEDQEEEEKEEGEEEEEEFQDHRILPTPPSNPTSHLAMARTLRPQEKGELAQHGPNHAPTRKSPWKKLW